ncbi:MAG: BCCT family transporter [Firmicutes bacterium]|nr:BCCT family transporter [Bacillota bacterium]
MRKNQVFIISLVVVAIIVGWGLIFPNSFGGATTDAFDFFVGNFGWFYLITMSLFVIFCLYLLFSKYGKIRLGPDDSKPEYSNISWFAMLFSAGMGVGLVFWGVAEPLNHFVNPLGMDGGTVEAANFAIKKSFLHWGLHPWANYTIIALPLAYMQFRKNKPGLISSIFIPLIGEERVKGPIGKIIDILAIFATVAGVATSLGMATMQTTSGLHFLYGLPETNLIRIVVITVITVLFMISAITGLDKGIKFLSNVNVTLCGVLIALGLIIGPTVLIINGLTSGIGDYLSSVVKDSFQIDPFGGSTWYGGWTIFYWAWWIAWAPFVGTFIARISKGRTIREFIGGVLVAPTLGSFVWFAVFGGIGINEGLQNFGIAQEAIQTTETALFVIMEQIPMGSIISTIAVILLCTFFVTSADSATFVLGMMSENGNLNPGTVRKLTWGVIQSVLAATLMLTGGLTALQTGSIVAAFPFAFVMIFAMWAILKALKNDEAVKSKALENN